MSVVVEDIGFVPCSAQPRTMELSEVSLRSRYGPGTFASIHCTGVRVQVGVRIGFGAGAGAGVAVGVRVMIGLGVGVGAGVGVGVGVGINFGS